jgi:hypothetical protein
MNILDSCRYTSHLGKSLPLPGLHLENWRSYLMNPLRIAQDFLRGLSLLLYPLGRPSVCGQSFVAPGAVGVIYDSRYSYSDCVPKLLVFAICANGVDAGRTAQAQC